LTDNGNSYRLLYTWFFQTAKIFQKSPPFFACRQLLLYTQKSLFRYRFLNASGHLFFFPFPVL